jgi:hypothetical protein
VRVPTNAAFGTEYVNEALIRSAHDDANTADNNSSLKTTVSVNRNTELSVSPASGTFGGSASLSATLNSGGAGLGNKTVNFTLNGSPVGSATTNAQGVATTSANLQTSTPARMPAPCVRASPGTPATTTPAAPAT